MSAAGRTKTWLLRVGIATAILTTVGVFANPGGAMAAEAGPAIRPERWAVLAFALGSFLASLGTARARPGFGFEPATVRRTSSAWARGGRSVRVPARTLQNNLDAA